MARRDKTKGKMRLHMRDGDVWMWHKLYQPCGERVKGVSELGAEEEKMPGNRKKQVLPPYIKANEPVLTRRTGFPQ
jgi:hypothetical protein